MNAWGLLIVSVVQARPGTSFLPWILFWEREQRPSDTFLPVQETGTVTKEEDLGFAGTGLGWNLSAWLDVLS